MAFRRQLGNLALLLLKSNMDQEQDQRNQQAIKDREMDVASYNRGSIEKQAELNRREGTLNDYRDHPDVALRALQGTANTPSDPEADPYVQRDREALAPSFDMVSKAQELNQLPSMSALFANRKPGIQTNLTPITELYNARQSQEANIKDANQAEVAQKGDEAYTTAYNTGSANNDVAGATLQDRIDQTNAMNTGTSASTASAGGATAGAEAGARFPWEEKLAKVRADFSLLNQQAIDEYKRSHPRATAQELNRQSGAHTALTTSGIIREEAKAMNDRGLMGPLASHWVDLAAGKVKAEALFKSPEDAQLAAKFISDTKLLQSLAANIHSGARGAASPALIANHWEKILSPNGDLSIFNGQLDAVDQIMTLYAKDPNAPAVQLPAYAQPPVSKSEFSSPVTDLTPGLAGRLGGR
jgi:hypothetical protein